MKFFIRSCTLIALFFVLSSMASVRINIMKPADIYIPSHIQKLIIVNRTLPPDKKANMIEGVLTGEGLNQDESAVSSTLNGLMNILGNSPVLKASLYHTNMIGSGTGGQFPLPLSWENVEEICEKTGSNAILALETFDSDFIITDGKKQVEKKGENGAVTKVTEFYAKGVATIKCGFRLYDLKGKSIVDEYRFSHFNTWNAGGSSVQDAILGLVDKNNATNDVSRGAGELYAKRITPSWYTVTRYFYNKPKKNKELMRGVRQSGVADWTGAIESWKQAMKTAKKDKHAARAAYNIAVAYEVLGDLQKAKEWISKSYVEYGLKDAKEYSDIIDYRIRQERILKEQLGK